MMPQPRMVSFRETYLPGEIGKYFRHEERLGQEALNLRARVTTSLSSSYSSRPIPRMAMMSFSLWITLQDGLNATRCRSVPDQQPADPALTAGGVQRVNGRVMCPVMRSDGSVPRLHLRAKAGWRRVSHVIRRYVYRPGNGGDRTAGCDARERPSLPPGVWPITYRGRHTAQQCADTVRNDRYYRRTAVRHDPSREFSAAVRPVNATRRRSFWRLVHLTIHQDVSAEYVGVGHRGRSLPLTSTFPLRPQTQSKPGSARSRCYG